MKRQIISAIAVILFLAVGVALASTYQAVVLNSRLVTTVDSAFYADIRYDASDAAPDYIGLNVTNGADTAGADWKVYKFSYTSSAVTRVQVAYGTWDGRVALFP
jgi:hypothetical protein